uniref:Cytochrome b-c1 complex subunit 8 n=1 Tax=Meloidogyne hapla TaxID=6305 RepID=A0A1I8BRV2_MELHA
MATRSPSLLEKITRNLAVLYRYHVVQKGPRRVEMLKKVWERELSPPTPKDWPQEFLVYSFVALEVFLWFFVGEQIGRWNMSGYVIPATYLDPKAVKFMKSYKPEDKTELAD